MNNIVINSKVLIDKVTTILEIGSEFREVYNERYALDFDPFQLFKIDENRLSKLFAFLLDPKETHGQKAYFLKTLLKTIPLNYPEETGAFEYIELEETTDTNRRLDIVISFKNIVVGIENKIWASDQPNQLSDYHKSLQTRGKKKSILIYLSPYGKEPSETSISKLEAKQLQDAGQLMYWSYTSDIMPFLKSSLGFVEPEILRNFILMMERYLSNIFIGKKSLLMDTKIKNLIKENLETTKAIASEYNNWISEIKTSFKNLILELKNQDGLIINEGVELKTLDFLEKGVHYFRNDFMKNDLYIVLQIAQIDTEVSIEIWSKSEEQFKQYFKNKTSLDFKKQNLEIEEIEKQFKQKRALLVQFFNDLDSDNL
ncbi:PD-(D/E)XK nuclease family protein [uncultured Dokdonia sp.]|mgnify:CR=1 FL=1|uniref:PDDEXK-like family protein n=1 Tax=uncultured Dokdonia sp. TaxID=575653 RepID=UPI0030EF26BB|tara:strand:- start:53242 stop:54354 length:1113 start_codon:yes stop_codon:yes gene_type:complete